MSESIHWQLVIRKEKGCRDWVAYDHPRTTIIRAGDAKRDVSTSTRLRSVLNIINKYFVRRDNINFR